MATDLKSLFGFVAIILTFVAFAPYIRSIVAGRTRPHIFSWIIWGAGTLIVFSAQLAGGGGFGAVPIGLSGLITIAVATLAFQRRGDISITALDWLFLIASALAIPLWVLAQSPLVAVVILTIIDLCGFGPSVRKAYHRPFEEEPLLYAIGAIRNGFVLLALDVVSWTTALFPAAVGAASAMFLTLILVRRQHVPPDL